MYYNTDPNAAVAPAGAPTASLLNAEQLERERKKRLRDASDPKALEAWLKQQEDEEAAADAEANASAAKPSEPSPSAKKQRTI
jgi:hypothetical protein